MTMTAMHSLCRLMASAALCALSAIASAQQAAEPADGRIDLAIDFARIVQIDGPIGAVVIGNPAIADATVTHGSTLVVTGLRPGTTNVITLDDDGRTMSSTRVVVGAAKPGTVRVRRAQQVATYTCGTGLCDRTALEDVGQAMP